MKTCGTYCPAFPELFCEVVSLLASEFTGFSDISFRPFRSFRFGITLINPWVKPSQPQKHLLCQVIVCSVNHDMFDWSKTMQNSVTMIILVALRS